MRFQYDAFISSDSLFQRLRDTILEQRCNITVSSGEMQIEEGHYVRDGGRGKSSRGPVGCHTGHMLSLAASALLETHKNRPRSCN